MDAGWLDRVSRRNLIAGALAAGVASSFSLQAQAQAQTDPAPTDEATLLGTTLEIEQVSVLAYQRALQLRGIGRAMRELLRQLLGHEHAHVGLLESELRARGVEPPPVMTMHRAQRLLATHEIPGDLTKLRNAKEALDLLLAIESLSQGAYYKLVERVREPALALKAAEALASEAQHATLLSELRHPGDVGRAVPDAFVQGRD